MIKMPMGTFFEEQYECSDIFNKLKLTDAEIGVLAAAMIICPGSICLLSMTSWIPYCFNKIATVMLI